MNIPKRYDPQLAEKRLGQLWEEKGIYHFGREDPRPVYSIDTPPPTVSGDLHLGHCYSYSQTDFLARFWRMSGYNVFYPMGWDDNGLPTERLVERRLGIKPVDIGREKFTEAILEVSRELETDYERLWRSIGLSIDWRYLYQTISPEARKVSQYSFIDLFRKRLAYKTSAPTIWCPLDDTAIAQAEVNDLERQTSFVTVAFKLEDGTTLPIATTRPELLPACVAVFVNPGDERNRKLVGMTAISPLFRKRLPIMADSKVNPEKGTGVVMCCTFGDTTDVEWWREYDLPLFSIIDHDGKLNETAGLYAGLSVAAAREKIILDLAEGEMLLDSKRTPQTIRVHERCDTPVEYIVTSQWFIKLLDHKEELLRTGREIKWHPSYMQARYEDWVQNLNWDWSISRQRYYGIPFPVWYCRKCGEIVLADETQLPVDPLVHAPLGPCQCGSTDFTPEKDVMDTWATSSVSPEIAGQWLEDQALFKQVFPMTLRPQAHDIIRTWAFYTIVKSLYHLGKLPWSNIAISGHGLAPEGTKISKSRGGVALDPNEMMKRYSADAIRYWSAGGKLGRDSLVSEEKIAAGNKLVTKLWNVARFALGFLDGYEPPTTMPNLTEVDRWVLSELERITRRATKSFEDYDYTSAKEEVEAFFWSTMADNYLEMVKGRLYELNDDDYRKGSAKYALYQMLLTVIKLFAPIMPYITDEIFQSYFASHEHVPSIHLSQWPQSRPELIDESAEALGRALVQIAGEARRYKSARQLSMGASLRALEVMTSEPDLLRDIESSTLDIKSVTKAQHIAIGLLGAQHESAGTDRSMLEVRVEE